MRSIKYRVAAAAVGVGVAAGTAGCSSISGRRADADAPAKAAVATKARTNVSFASSSARVAPNGNLTVVARGGALTKVTATASGGKKVPGRITADGSRWKSTGYLPVNAKVTVRATTKSRTGVTSTSTHVYTTVAAHDTEKVDFTPSNGTTVGVAMPVVATFDNRVTNKAAVERRLTVHSNPGVQGSWHWMSDHEVIYRPANYWPAGTRVTVSGNLAGVELSKGVWGVNRKPVTFRVGARNEDTVDIGAHTLTVKTDGRVIRTIPVSTGKPGATTRTRMGIKVIMSQEKTVNMSSTPDATDKYHVTAHWAQRLTTSGEYFHAAPWNAAYFGRKNASHGCTGMSTADAEWLMEHSRVGDPVRFVNGTRPLDSGNGWTMWNQSYQSWKAGSALK